jgi:cysteine desulfuration protein SufE
VTDQTTTQAPLPAAMQEIAEDFAALTPQERLQLLLEFSEGLPDLPDRYAAEPGKLEQVHECQSPLFLAVEVGGQVGGQVGDEVGAPGPDDPGAQPVHLFFQAPQEAPTTRGFAGILYEGLNGLSVDEVLAVPEDAPYRFSLGEAVSPLRLRGMVGMLSRIKRQAALKSRA